MTQAGERQRPGRRQGEVVDQAEGALVLEVDDGLQLRQEVPAGLLGHEGDLEGEGLARVDVRGHRRHAERLQRRQLLLLAVGRDDVAALPPVAVAAVRGHEPVHAGDRRHVPLDDDLAVGVVVDHHLLGPRAGLEGSVAEVQRQAVHRDLARRAVVALHEELVRRGHQIAQGLAGAGDGALQLGDREGLRAHAADLREEVGRHVGVLVQRVQLVGVQAAEALHRAIAVGLDVGVADGRGALLLDLALGPDEARAQAVVEKRLGVAHQHEEAAVVVDGLGGHEDDLDREGLDQGGHDALLGRHLEDSVLVADHRERHVARAVVAQVEQARLHLAHLDVAEVEREVRRPFLGEEGGAEGQRGLAGLGRGLGRDHLLEQRHSRRHRRAFQREDCVAVAWSAEGVAVVRVAAHGQGAVLDAHRQLPARRDHAGLRVDVEDLVSVGVQTNQLEFSRNHAVVGQHDFFGLGDHAADHLVEGDDLVGHGDVRELSNRAQLCD